MQRKNYEMGQQNNKNDLPNVVAQKFYDWNLMS